MTRGTFVRRVLLTVGILLACWPTSLAYGQQSGRWAGEKAARGTQQARKEIQGFGEGFKGSGGCGTVSIGFILGLGYLWRRANRAALPRSVSIGEPERAADVASVKLSRQGSQRQRTAA